MQLYKPDFSSKAHRGRKGGREEGKKSGLPHVKQNQHFTKIVHTLFW